MAECRKTVWSEREALIMKTEKYEAMLVPSMGANVLRLYAYINGKTIDILHTPEHASDLLSNPFAYGIPVLFPANRVSGGSYTWDGITYSFPQNYPNHVHIHGVLHNREWPVESICVNDDSVAITLAISTENDEALHSHFPVNIKISLQITLDNNGLHHCFTLKNNSDHVIPAGLAYHTSIRTDFGFGSSGIYLHVPLKEQCTESTVDRMPDEKTKPLDEYEKKIASEKGASPQEKAIDFLYTSKGRALDAIMRDESIGYEVVYHSDIDNFYWVLWNASGHEGFISVEPQTWLTNAVNSSDPVRNGAIFVAPHSSWTNTCSIYVR